MAARDLSESPSPLHRNKLTGGVTNSHANLLTFTKLTAIIRAFENAHFAQEVPHANASVSCFFSGSTYSSGFLW
jgi:hypothetical protein